MDSTGEIDLSEFEQRLRLLLYELNGKRVQVTMCQRELSSVLLAKLELERQVDCQCRAAKAGQLQLQLAAQASQRSDAERESLAQRATRSEVQLALVSQEVAISRQECRKLELQGMQLRQQLTEQSEQLQQLSTFRDSSAGLQSRVKSAVLTASKEAEALKVELQSLGAAAQLAGKQSVDFQAAVRHFVCLEERQAGEREKQARLLADMKAKVDYLMENQKQAASCAPEVSSNLLKEYQNSLSAMEQRLTAERETSARLGEALTKALGSQQALQQAEARLSAGTSSLQAELSASQAAQAELRRELEQTRAELLGRKEGVTVETQTSEGPPTPKEPHQD